MKHTLVELLRLLLASGSAGFEGLIAALLESITERHFSLAASGSQDGRDMSSRGISSNVIVVECKRYAANNSLDRRELLGELLQVTLTIPDLDACILVASRSVTSQVAEELHQAALRLGVNYFVLSAGDGSPSSLEVLCAYSPEIMVEFLEKKNIATRTELEPLLQAIRKQSEYEGRIRELKSSLSSPLLGYENWRTLQNQWFIDCLKSERTSRAAFGQQINVQDPRIQVIERKEVWSAMADWLREWNKTHRNFVALGEEGDGKTWSVASWLSYNIQHSSFFPAVIFLSSTSIDTQDPDLLLSNAVSQRLKNSTQDQAIKRSGRWLERTNADLPLFVLVLDGINERRSPEWWRTLLDNLAGDPWYRNVAVIITCRSSYWQRSFQTVQNIGTSVVTVSSYTDTELDAALTNHNLQWNDIASELLTLIRKPRYFELMVQYRTRLAESGDITVARLIYEDWRDRYERKSGLPMNDTEFQSIIRHLAQTYQNQGATFQEQDIVTALPFLSERERALEELRTGGVVQMQRDGYKVNHQLLAYGLGLLLAEQVEQAVEDQQDVMEVIAGWLEPQAEMDIKAEICEYAALHALDAREFSLQAKVALLQAWIDSRNPQKDIDEKVAAYLPIDPSAYVDLAEVVWSETYDNGWAQELLIRLFISSYQNPQVAPILRSALERWLGFVHIQGSPFERETSKNPEEIPQEISQRINQVVSVGSFSFAGYSFTGIDDDGQLRLGRAALAIISHLPRSEFIHTIAVGCLAEAVMGRAYKYDLFAWVIRSSADPIWSYIRDEAEHLLGIDSIVTKRAATRLLLFEGSEEAANLASRIPRDIFPPSRLAQLYRNNPCDSGFAWSEEDCITCMQRDNLAIEYVARQIKTYCINPNLPVPERLEAQFATLIDQINSHEMWSLFGRTEADFNFEQYEPCLTAYAPRSVADFVRAIVRQIDGERQGAAFRQLCLNLREHYLIFGVEEKEAIQRAWEQLISTQESWGESEETGEMYLFQIVLKSLPAENQLSSLLRRPERAHDWLDYEPNFSAISDWNVVQVELSRATSTKSIGRILWFISAFPMSVPHDLLSTLILPFLTHSESYIRSLVLEIAYGAKESVSIQAICQSDWTWSTPNGDIENHWGSIVLSKYGLSIPFNELARRVHPSYLGYAIQCRGSKANEIHIYSDVINQIWLRLNANLTHFPEDMPHFDVEANLGGEIADINRWSLHKDPASRTIVFQNPHASWGGIRDDSSNLLSLDSNKEANLHRHRALLEIIHNTIKEQEASGNIWFARRVQSTDLAQVMETYPSLASVWVNAIMSDDEGSLRRLNQNSAFYSALFTALLEQNVEMAIGLYRQLQKAGQLTHITDKNTGIELLDFDLFRANAHPILSIWMQKLEECVTDQELLRVALLSRYGSGKDWLWSYIIQRISSSAPLERARAITLLGFFDGPEAIERLNQLCQIPIESWFKDLAQLSKKRWERMAWSKHWFRRFLVVEDDILAWAALRLFLQCANTQFWHWLQDIKSEIREDEVTTQRWKFLQDNNEEIHHSIQDNEKDLAKYFLGQKVLQREAWPWMSLL